jgi:hypothetical protein
MLIIPLNKVKKNTRIFKLIVEVSMNTSEKSHLKL